jgi:hypothetical protein
LADAFLHASAALFDQVADVPLRNALLDATGQDGGRVRGHGLVGGEECDVELFEFPLDAGGVGGHARKAVDALHDHCVEAAAVRGDAEQVRKAAVARQREPEGSSVCARAAVA